VYRRKRSRSPRRRSSTCQYTPPAERKTWSTGPVGTFSTTASRCPKGSVVAGDGENGERWCCALTQSVRRKYADTLVTKGMTPVEAVAVAVAAIPNRDAARRVFGPRRPNPAEMAAARRVIGPRRPNPAEMAAARRVIGPRRPNPAEMAAARVLASEGAGAAAMSPGNIGYLVGSEEERQERARLFGASAPPLFGEFPMGVAEANAEEQAEQRRRRLAPRQAAAAKIQALIRGQKARKFAAKKRFDRLAEENFERQRNEAAARRLAEVGNPNFAEIVGVDREQAMARANAQAIAIPQRAKLRRNLRRRDMLAQEPLAEQLARTLRRSARAAGQGFGSLFSLARPIDDES